MELSLAFIASKLRRRYPVSLRGADGYFRQIDNPRHIAESPTFTTARVYTGKAPVERGQRVLAIVRSDQDLPKSVAESLHGVLWIGHSEPPRGLDVLWIAAAADPLALLDEVLGAFETCQSWAESISNMLLAHRPVPNVVAKLGEATPNPFWLADSSLHVLYMSENEELAEHSPKWRHQAETGRYSSEVINRLVSSGELELIDQRRRAWLYEPADETVYTLPFVSKTISLKGGVYGHVFIIEMEPGNVPQDLALAEELGDLIATYVQHGMPASRTGKRYTDQLLRSCLAGDEVSDEERSELLSLLGWKDSQGFYVAIFDRQDTKNGDGEAPEVQVDQVQSRFPDARAFAYDAYVVLVGSTVGSDRDTGLAALAEACGELGWKVGVSCEFSRFAQLDSHYGQAQIALRKGLALDPGASVYSYADYQLPYLCQKLATAVPRPLLMHRDVEQLIAYDAENDSELLRTLCAYLDCERNVSQTAKALYLHRNSVNYRIDKIASIVESDLDDPANRLAIRLSIEVWRRERERLR